MEAFIECGVLTRLFDLKANHIRHHDRSLSAKFVAVVANAEQRHDAHGCRVFGASGLSPKAGWEGRVGIPFGSYGWGTNGPDEVAAALEACGFDLPLGTLSHQWIEDEDHLARLQETIKQGVAG
ncbi:MAG: hypothetical protein ACLTMP_11380 [Eggerthella lenta]